MSDLNYIPPTLDPASAAAIDAIHNRTMGQSADSIAQSTMENTGQGAGLLGTDQASVMQGQHLAPGGDDSILKAINDRTQRKYDSAMKDLGIRAQGQAQHQITERQARAADLLQKEQSYNDTIRQMKNKAAQDRKLARAQTIGQIIGIGGAIVGGTIGGAPGAMAGLGVGTGVGTMAGNAIEGE